ncbi:hypothetical protein HDU93_002185 [Gonapodya sp. JEL0774]|nr:hypothetical protein HDU93_002185 [Gonapodya sp. JEL0774]
MTAAARTIPDLDELFAPEALPLHNASLAVEREGVYLVHPANTHTDSPVLPLSIDGCSFFEHSSLTPSMCPVRLASGMHQCIAHPELSSTSSLRRLRNVGEEGGLGFHVSLDNLILPDIVDGRPSSPIFSPVIIPHIDIPPGRLLISVTIATSDGQDLTSTHRFHPDLTACQPFPLTLRIPNLPRGVQVAADVEFPIQVSFTLDHGVPADPPTKQILLARPRQARCSEPFLFTYPDRGMSVYAAVACRPHPPTVETSMSSSSSFPVVSICTATATIPKDPVAFVTSLPFQPPAGAWSVLPVGKQSPSYLTCSRALQSLVKKGYCGGEGPDGRYHEVIRDMGSLWVGVGHGCHVALRSALAEWDNNFGVLLVGEPENVKTPEGLDWANDIEWNMFVQVAENLVADPLMIVPGLGSSPLQDNLRRFLKSAIQASKEFKCHPPSLHALPCNKPTVLNEFLSLSIASALSRRLPQHPNPEYDLCPPPPPVPPSWSRVTLHGAYGGRGPIHPTQAFDLTSPSRVAVFRDAASGVWHVTTSNIRRMYIHGHDPADDPYFGVATVDHVPLTGFTIDGQTFDRKFAALFRARHDAPWELDQTAQFSWRPDPLPRRGPPLGGVLVVHDGYCSAAAVDIARRAMGVWRKPVVLADIRGVGLGRVVCRAVEAAAAGRADPWKVGPWRDMAKGLRMLEPPEDPIEDDEWLVGQPRCLGVLDPISRPVWCSALFLVRGRSEADGIYEVIRRLPGGPSPVSVVHTGGSDSGIEGGFQVGGCAYASPNYAVVWRLSCGFGDAFYPALAVLGNSEASVTGAVMMILSEGRWPRDRQVRVISIEESGAVSVVVEL